jgi:acyl-CoA thioesterase-1
MSRALILILFLGLAPAARAAGSVILVFGDSLSAGYGVDLGKGWVDLLARRMAERHLGYTVVNASISGDTTGGGLARLPAALARERPAIVILELGANDGLRGQPIDRMQSNLGRMIALSRKAGAKVLLVGMRLPPNYGPAYTEKFAAAYTELAHQTHVAFLPFLLAGVAQDPGLMQADNLHPNAAGQPRLLENVWPRLRPLLAPAAITGQ